MPHNHGAGVVEGGEEHQSTVLALPHIVATHTLPEEQRGCSTCGGRLEELEGQFETSETIDVVDVEYRVIQQRRQKYVCRCGGHVKTAPAPEPAVCGGRYSVAFAVKVAVDKYLHHLPLARQVRMMGLRGLEAARRRCGTRCRRSERSSSRAGRRCYDVRSRTA